MQEAQATQELENIVSSIKPYNPACNFKAMVYNVAPKSANLQQLQNSKYQPRADTNDFYYVDTKLAEDALIKNPDPERLYPWQINSCKQLAERVTGDLDTANILSFGLDNMEAHLREIEGGLNLRIKERLKTITNSQADLSERLCTVRQKLEQYLEQKNSIQKDLGEELKLRVKVDHLQKKLEIKSKLEKINTQGLVADAKFEIPKDELESILKVLKDQRDNAANLRRLVLSDANLVTNIHEALQKINKD